jgi:hypothetical protein
VRSEDQIAFQQFSTPPALAMLAVHLARLSSTTCSRTERRHRDHRLAWHGRRANTACSTNSNLPAPILEGLFPGSPVYRHDGAKSARCSQGTDAAERVVMNPPFSISQSRGKIRTPRPGTCDPRSTICCRAGGRRDHAGLVLTVCQYEETFRRTLEGARVVLSLRLDKGGYAKHGTGIAVRVLVIDKVAGRDRHLDHQPQPGRRTLRRASNVPPARAIARIHAALSCPAPKLSLFRSVKTGPARPVIVRARTDQ